MVAMAMMMIMILMEALHQEALPDHDQEVLLDQEALPDHDQEVLLDPNQQVPVDPNRQVLVDQEVLVNQEVLLEQDQRVLVDHDQEVLALLEHDQQGLVDRYLETLHEDDQVALGNLMVGIKMVMNIITTTIESINETLMIAHITQKE